MNQVAELELRPKADVALVVGTRFLDNLSQPRPMNPETTILRIDIDAEEIHRDVKPAVEMVGDAKAGLAALIDLLEQMVGERPSRQAEFEELKRRVTERINSVMPQAGFGLAIRNALPDDGVIVGEMTQIAYWSNFAMPIYQPNTYITPGYQGTLGWGFCTSLGVKVGKPDSPVVSINGDGGFGFALNELATMAQHEIPAIALVFNDCGVRQRQADPAGRSRRPRDRFVAPEPGLRQARRVLRRGRPADGDGRGSADGDRGVDQGQRADPDRDPGRPDAESLDHPRPALDRLTSEGYHAPLGASPGARSMVSHHSGLSRASRSVSVECRLRSCREHNDRAAGPVVILTGPASSPTASVDCESVGPAQFLPNMGLPTTWEEERAMTYVITQPCIGTKDASCVEVCPVDCIHSTDEADQYFINPDECIDCGVCAEVCPVEAIFFEDDVPEQWANFIPLNKAFFDK